MSSLPCAFKKIHERIKTAVSLLALIRTQFTHFLIKENQFQVHGILRDERAMTAAAQCSMQGRQTEWVKVGTSVLIHS